jgi:predicted  nucleic acid-binding Zn-ribbon protein
LDLDRYTMELQQIMEMLAKTDGRQEEMKDQMASLTSWIDAYREKMKITQAEIKEDIKANRAKRDAN